MKLPPDIADAVIAATAKELADRAAPTLDDLQLVPISRAAELLGVSANKARELIREVVDLGESSRRVRVSVLRRIIEARTIQLQTQ